MNENLSREESGKQMVELREPPERGAAAEENLAELWKYEFGG